MKTFLVLLALCSFGLIQTAASSKHRQRYINQRKDAWLDSHLSRSRRNLFQLDEIDKSSDAALRSRHFYRPCPRNCNCNFDTINCNDLIDQCTECVHWSKIDFNQIGQMRPRSFHHFRFSPNHTTHIIIYKLLNSTIGAGTFEGMHLPRNAHVEITFQYNSLIKFDKNILRGLRLDTNASLVFNFPYTTQVLFMAKCFDGVLMKDSSSKLIIRILKSFSVRFAGDFSYYFHHHNPFYKQPVNESQSPNSSSESASPEPLHWSIPTGQFIIDIKSTHLVKFDEYSFSHLNLKSNAKLFIDLELVEKLMMQRYSFANLELSSHSQMVLFSKQITFIDFKAYSFSSITLNDNAKMEIYLEELMSSLCLQRNVFTNMRLKTDEDPSAASTFNFSIINSKNVQLMHHAFSNVAIENPNSRVFVGVFNMPSFLLLFQNDHFFKMFLFERLKYLNLPTAALPGQLLHHHQPLLASHMHHHANLHNQYSGNSYVAQPFPANSEYFYNNLNVNNGFDDSVVYTMDNQILNVHNLDIAKFYANNKQIYSYNFSLEKNCFFNLTVGKTSLTHAKPALSIVADNIHTMFLDDFVFNQTLGLSVNFVLNLKHLVLSKNALSYLGYVGINFLKEPRVFKFGLASFRPNQKQQRFIKITGLNLINSTDPYVVDFDYNYNVVDYFNESPLESETPSLIVNGGKRNSNSKSSKKESSYRIGNQVNAFIDGFCQFKSISAEDTVIRVEPRKNDKENEPVCSCQIIYLLQNQLKAYSSLHEIVKSKVLPCNLNSFDFIDSCMTQLETKCDKPKTLSDSDEMPNQEDSNFKFLKGYVKFWEYCISEQEPLIKGSYMSNANIENENSLLFNGMQESGGGIFNFNDMDSLSSSLLDPTIDTQLKSSMFDASNALGDSESSFSPLPTDLDKDPSGDDSGLSNNIGKIVGIVVICFVVGISLFMIAINIIQYKFRNDLFDDFECSSQNITIHASGDNRSGVSASGNRDCKSNLEGRNCNNEDFDENDSRNDKNSDDDDGPVGVECEESEGKYKIRTNKIAI
jgi:hypothetical protein